MSTKLGHFEILSELSKSPTCVVYKANDPESGQTIALKAIQLSAFGEHASALEQALLAEAESTKVLSCPNITNVYGAGEIEGKFCAAMEYVQGNSIATMLARKEGFSIWDLLDIGRQLSSGLDHAASHNVVHHSLEPAKIMCGWDGTIKILSYGISKVGDFVHLAEEGLSPILHYISPEQIRGEAMDIRSNLFSLGAMFYEMLTERKAFDRDDIDSLRQSILESTPVAPIHVNPKINPLLSDLIMKALAKDPGERYQTGRELLDDLEKCKESKPTGAKKTEPAKGTSVPSTVKAAAATKSVSGAGAKSTSTPARPAAKPAVTAAVSKSAATPITKSVSKTATPKAAAAAAGVGPSNAGGISADIQELDLSEHSVQSSYRAVSADTESPSAHMSSAVIDEPEVETFEAPTEDGPKISVDPMMAEGGSGAGGGTSFSEISELPPLKDVYVVPPAAPQAAYQPVQQPAAPVTMFDGADEHTEQKPKVQPREVAEKAIKEIKSVPPRLMLYSLAAAGILILIIGIGMTIYIHNLGSEEDPGATRVSKPVEEQTPAQPQASQPEPPVASQQPSEPAAVASQPVEESPEAVATQRSASTKSRNQKKKSAAPVIIPGQIAVESNPEGAQVEINGKTDPTWITPLSLPNLEPGQYSINVSKAGYSSDSRTLNVTAGNRASVSIHLSPLLATLVVKSDPPGASIYVDGHDVGAKAPAQVSVGKGQHVVLVRLSGYLDETMNGQFTLGQTYNFTPALKPLGNVDSIKTVGKMSKFFGGKADPNQATLSIRTQPKGAQITVNQRMLDKGSPVDVAVDPGNYVVDITLTGYAPVHKVVTAEKKAKLVIDEVLQPQ